MRPMKSLDHPTFEDEKKPALKNLVLWYSTVILGVFLSGILGVWAKNQVWDGNAFIHELSFADEALNRSTQVLFVGSSHTFQGVDPRLIDKNSANLGYPEANLSICQLLIKKHIARLPNLKLIVIQCEPWSFTIDSLARQKYNYRTLIDQGVSVWSIPLPPKEKLLAIRNTLSGADYPSVTPSNLRGRRIQQSQWTGVAGFKPPTIANRKKTDEQPTTKSTAVLPPAVSFESQMQALSEVIQICQSHDVDLKLISYPHTKNYEKNQDSLTWQSSIEQLIQVGLLTEQDVWNFYDNAIIDFSDESDFNDSNHLHPDAIPKFCKILNQLVNETLAK